MARRISIVMDAQPVVPSPEIHKINYPSKEENEVDYNIIEERESEIDELMKDFICALVGADEPEERDMVSYGLQDELESLKDEFEEVLANHGIIIYRPTIIEGADGNEIVTGSLYEGRA